jgi:hypothetical protein
VPRERDLIHARCSGYAHRRLTAAGLQTAREVEIVDGRTHGWIDLLAFDPQTGRLFIVEIKTGLDDLGAVERQIGWYERLVERPAQDRGWRVTVVHSWLLVLATADVDAAIARQRDLLDAAFPQRAVAMRRVLARVSPAAASIAAASPVAASPAAASIRLGSLPTLAVRGLALIDPTRRRHEWLLPSRLDGRRTAAPYRDRADALRRLGGDRPWQAAG